MREEWCMCVCACVCVFVCVRERERAEPFCIISLKGGKGGMVWQRGK